MTYTVKRGIIATDVDGDVVLLNARTGRYFGLNESGAHVWRGVLARETAAQIAVRLVTDMDVDQGVAMRDTVEVLQALEANGIITSLKERRGG